MQKISSKRMVIVALVIGSLLWSTAGFSGKILLRFADPYVVAFYRFFIASIIITPFFIKSIKNNSYPSFPLILISFIGGLNVPLFYLGLNATTANSAQIIYAGCPLVTLIMAKYLIGEISSIKRFIGIILGLFGVAIIIVLPIWQSGKIIIGDFNGNLIIATGMLTWSLYSVLCRYYSTKKSLQPLTITSMFIYISTILALVFAIFSKQNIFTKQIVNLQFIIILAYSSIFITIITYFLYQWVIQRVNATTASLKNYLEPLFAIVLNIIILNEVVNTGFIIATGLIIIGVILSTDLNTYIRNAKTKKE